MPLRILVVPDKFKGTLDAFEAAGAIAAGWSSERPGDSLELLQMSDGGDGFGKVMGRLLGASIRYARTWDAAGRRVRAPWWFHGPTKTAIIESASVIGLAQLPKGKFHPYRLDTYGLGKVLSAAARISKKIIVGIGGSASNDGGFGVARALGWKFLSREGSQIRHWNELDQLHRIERPTYPFPAVKILVAVDVTNRLLGQMGASRIYGPQKGLRPGDFAHAEKCLAKLAAYGRRVFKKDYAELPGSGAAGGLGFGLAAFLGAELVPGFELFAHYSKLKRRLNQADLVITAEGSLDESSLMGKGTGEVARMAFARKIPCVGLAGIATDEARKSKYFRAIYTLEERTSAARARREAQQWLRIIAREAAARHFA
jgi:glycerate kinase